jgi:hypothetical protein
MRRKGQKKDPYSQQQIFSARRCYLLVLEGLQLDIAVDFDPCSPLCLNVRLRNPKRLPSGRPHHPNFRERDLPGLVFEGDVVRPILQLISVD